MDTRANTTPVTENGVDKETTDSRVVRMMVRLIARRLTLKLILPENIMRTLVTSGSSILIIRVKEAEVRPRLAFVNREP